MYIRLGARGETKAFCAGAFDLTAEPGNVFFEQKFRASKDLLDINKGA